MGDKRVTFGDVKTIVILEDEDWSVYRRAGTLRLLDTQRFQQRIKDTEQILEKVIEHKIMRTKCLCTDHLTFDYQRPAV